MKDEYDSLDFKKREKKKKVIAGSRDCVYRSKEVQKSINLGKQVALFGWSGGSEEESQEKRPERGSKG